MLGFISVWRSKYININWFFFSGFGYSSLLEKNITQSVMNLWFMPTKTSLWTLLWIITVCLHMISWKVGKALKYCCQKYADEFCSLAVTFRTSHVVCQHLAQPQPHKTDHILGEKKTKQNIKIHNFWENPFVTVYQGFTCICSILNLTSSKSTSSWWTHTDFLQWVKRKRMNQYKQGIGEKMNTMISMD